MLFLCPAEAVECYLRAVEIYTDMVSCVYPTISLVGCSVSRTSLLLILVRWW